MAPPARFERATFNLGGCRSIHLSYGGAAEGLVSAVRLVPQHGTSRLYRPPERRVLGSFRVVAARITIRWCARRDSNARHLAPEASALSPELRAQLGARRTRAHDQRHLARSAGFEPATFGSVVRCAIQLRHERG